MIDKEQHIVEMAKVLEQAKLLAIGTIGSLNKGWGMWYAEILYNAGYRKEKVCKNITQHRHDEEFICSNCGFGADEICEIEIDNETGEVDTYDFEVKYCPRCGAKVEENEE